MTRRSVAIKLEIYLKCCGLKVQSQFNSLQTEAYITNPVSFLLTYRSASLSVEINLYGLVKHDSGCIWVWTLNPQPTTLYIYKLRCTEQSSNSTLPKAKRICHTIYIYIYIP
jgi:hypothetical protein